MAVLTLSAAVLAQGRPAALALKKGDVWKALVSWRFIDKESEIDETHVERVEANVIEAAPLKIQISRKLAQTIVNGDAIPALAGVKPEEYTEAVSPRNELLGSTQPILGPSQVRLSRLLRVILPAGPLDGRWSVDVPGKPEEGIPDAAAQYAVVGRSEHDGRTFTKIRLRFEERTEIAISGEGSAEIDNLTGLVSEMRLKVANVYPPGGTQRTGLELNYTVSSLPKR